MAKKSSIVVSLRSKGLPSFNPSLWLDVRYQAVQLTTEFLDVFLAFFVSVACLSWSSWISIAVIACSIAGTQVTDFASADIDMVFVFFMYLVLPLLVLLGFVFRRRESALRSLADLKASFVTLLLQRPVVTHCPAGAVAGNIAGTDGGTAAVAVAAVAAQAQREASEDLHRRAVAFIDDLRQYLQHRRPYVRHFYLPYRHMEPSPTDELLRVSRELGVLQRKVHRGVRDMHLACARAREAGVSEAQVAACVAEVKAIHAATERLINIKEARTPVVLRAALRWFMVVLIPVTMGPFWNRIAVMLKDNGAYSGILGVLTHVALMAIVDTVVAMEDPFDDTALDAISLYEMIDHVGVMTTPVTDADGGEPEASIVRRTANGTGNAAAAAAANAPVQREAFTAARAAPPGAAHVGVYVGDAAATAPPVNAAAAGSAGNGSGGCGGAAAPELAAAAAGQTDSWAPGAAATVGAGARAGSQPGGEGPGGAAVAATGGAPGAAPESVASTAEQYQQQQQQQQYQQQQQHQQHPQPQGRASLPQAARKQLPAALLRQPGGQPTMRASAAPSETTAVGPPSASTAEPYHVGGGGGGMGFSMPSITSTAVNLALPEVGVPTHVRAPVAMPPMPALAGHAMYRTHASGAASAQLYRAL